MKNTKNSSPEDGITKGYTVNHGNIDRNNNENSMFVSLFPILLIFVVFFLLIIRPQNKKQKELDRVIKNLDIGDAVVTVSGFIGVVKSIHEDLGFIVLSIDSSDSTIVVYKSAIAGMLNNSDILNGLKGNKSTKKNNKK